VNDEGLEEMESRWGFIVDNRDICMAVIITCFAVRPGRLLSVRTHQHRFPWGSKTRCMSLYA